jgi:hypothetical protein
MMNEHSQGVAKQAVSKSSDRLKHDILHYKIKEIESGHHLHPEKSEKIKEDLRAGMMAEIENGLAEYIRKEFLFDPNEIVKDLIFHKTLEAIIASGPEDFKFHKEVEELFLESLGQKIIAESLKTGENFHDVLSHELRNLKNSGAHLDNEKINMAKMAWWKEYEKLRLAKESED